MDNRRRVWDVFTDDPNDGPKIYLGQYEGRVHDIAISLGDKQRGFWCDGTLTFRVHKPEPAPPLVSKRWANGKGVNVVVDITSLGWSKGNSETDLVAAKKFFKSAPVDVVECNLYGAVTIKPKSEKKA